MSGRLARWLRTSSLSHTCSPPMVDHVVTVPWQPGLTVPCTCRRWEVTADPDCPWHGTEAEYRKANPRTAIVGQRPAQPVGSTWRCDCRRRWRVMWDNGRRRGGHTAAHATWRPA